MQSIWVSWESFNFPTHTNSCEILLHNHHYLTYHYLQPPVTGLNNVCFFLSLSCMSQFWSTRHLTVSFTNFFPCHKRQKHNWVSSHSNFFQGCTDLMIQVKACMIAGAGRDGWVGGWVIGLAASFFRERKLSESNRHKRVKSLLHTNLTTGPVFNDNQIVFLPQADPFWRHDKNCRLTRGKQWKTRLRLFREAELVNPSA